jgi:hypothetical protein
MSRAGQSSDIGGNFGVLHHLATSRKPVPWKPGRCRSERTLRSTDLARRAQRTGHFRVKCPHRPKHAAAPGALSDLEGSPRLHDIDDRRLPVELVVLSHVPSRLGRRRRPWAARHRGGALPRVFRRANPAVFPLRQTARTHTVRDGGSRPRHLVVEPAAPCANGAGAHSLLRRSMGPVAAWSRM